MADQLRMWFESDRVSGAPQDVAEVVARALTDERPRTRYVVSANGRMLVGLRWALSDRVLDRALRRQFGWTATGSYTGKHAAG